MRKLHPPNSQTSIASSQSRSSTLADPITFHVLSQPNYLSHALEAALVTRPNMVNNTFLVCFNGELYLLKRALLTYFLSITHTLSPNHIIILVTYLYLNSHYSLFLTLTEANVWDSLSHTHTSIETHRQLQVMNE